MTKYIKGGIYIFGNRVWKEDSKGKYHLISWCILRCIDCGQFLKLYHGHGNRCHKCYLKYKVRWLRIWRDKQRHIK